MMSSNSSIAIVGLSYRAPGVAEAKPTWPKIPVDCLEQDAFYSPGVSRRGCSTTEGAHSLPGDVYGFDAAFFHMRNEEAQDSNPQHRMMLECALEAAENAGHTLLDLAGRKIGVYVGAVGGDYHSRMAEDLSSTSTFAASGVLPCMAANILSYFFDINGLSITMDAVCASSTYETHQACQAINNSDCDAAFVGSPQLCLTPDTWLGLERMGALAIEGRSYSYDHKASGFGRGEGAVCFLIKRVDDDRSHQSSLVA